MLVMGYLNGLRRLTLNSCPHRSNGLYHAGGVTEYAIEATHYFERQHAANQECAVPEIEVNAGNAKLNSSEMKKLQRHVSLLED